METKTVQIMLVSLIQKITNLITTLDFIQSEPVSDVVKATTFRLYFVSEDGEKISNENIYVADNRDPASQNRIFRMRFTFKNKNMTRTSTIIWWPMMTVMIWRYSVMQSLWIWPSQMTLVLACKG